MNTEQKIAVFLRHYVRDTFEPEARPALVHLISDAVSASTAAESVLRDLEWAGVRFEDREAPRPACPACNREQREGLHQRACSLAAAIGATTEPEIDFAVVIRREDSCNPVPRYQVWLAEPDALHDAGGDPTDIHESILAGSFPTFDAATAAILEAFPGRVVNVCNLEMPVQP